LRDAIRFSVRKKRENDTLLSALDEIEVSPPDYVSF